MRLNLGWIKDNLTAAVATRRDRFVFRALAIGAGLYLDMLANQCYSSEVNGEERVLRILAESSPRCIFDVGANVGDWTAMAAQSAPAARIHAFEIVPDVASLTRQRFAAEAYSRITTNAFGLSDQPGTVPVAFSSQFTERSSVVLAPPEMDTEWRDCTVESGDEYCRDRGIDHIDFLKIDVEGLEDKVLKGFDGMLRSGRVDVIQFEYGRVNATIRFLLGDFYDLLEGLGYSVGKIYPDGVDFRAYDAWRDEDFRGPNYLAVHRSRDDLIRRLAAPTRR